MSTNPKHRQWDMLETLRQCRCPFFGDLVSEGFVSALVRNVREKRLLHHRRLERPSACDARELDGWLTSFTSGHTAWVSIRNVVLMLGTHFHHYLSADSAGNQLRQGVWRGKLSVNAWSHEETNRKMARRWIKKNEVICHDLHGKVLVSSGLLTWTTCCWNSVAIAVNASRLTCCFD